MTLTEVNDKDFNAAKLTLADLLRGYVDARKRKIEREAKEPVRESKA